MGLDTGMGYAKLRMLLASAAHCAVSSFTSEATPMVDKNVTSTLALNAPATGTTVEIDPITSDKQTLYLDASVVFNQLPSVTRDYVVALAKNKFAQEILAVGTLTDAKMAAFSTAWLQDMVTSQYKSLVKVQHERDEKRRRELYKALRERGITVAEASKASGYNPLV